MNYLDRRRLLSVLCHASLYGSPLVVPIAIPLIIQLVADDSVIKGNAREAVNFFVNYLAFAFTFGLLTPMIMLEHIILPKIVVLFFLAAMLLLCLVILVLPAIAIISVIKNPHKPHRYPFILRLVKPA